MNSNPNEVRVKLLSYLPGNDVHRFNRLNKFYGGFIAENQRFLAKPTVMLTIGIGPMPSMFSIRVKKASKDYCVGYLDSKKKLILQTRDRHGMATLKNSFLECASHQPPFIPHMSFFFTWLLNNYDLECLELQNFAETGEICALLEEAMSCVQFRCPTVAMTNGTHIVRFCPGLGKNFLPKLCAYQKKLGVKTELRISNGADSDDCHYLRDFCMCCCSYYAKHFNGVLCEDSYSTMMQGIHSIVKAWDDGYRNCVLEWSPFETMNFQIRYKYNRKSTCSLTRSSAERIAAFITENYYLENMEKEAFLELLEFEALDNLPEEIVWKNHREKRMLKIKLAKEERAVVLTFDFK